MKKATGICALAVLLPALFFMTRIPPPLPAAEPAAEPKESYSGAPVPEAAPRPAVYVGARVCATCHVGRQQGDQMSRWLLSKHSRAYAALARPESKQIAELSGIPLEPQRSTMCLGCHSTGTFAEASEKDDTFFAEDGVQCELCHGPGSEHAEAQATMSVAAAKRAALPMPTMRDCMGCHKEKGSHTAVLKRPAVDMNKAWDSIAHPMPPDWAQHTPPKPLMPAAARSDAPRYTGVMACAKCHREANLGYQFSHWRTSEHARAYAVLATWTAYAMAKKAGVEGDPARSPACLKCHATAFHDGAGGVLETYSLEEGVGCEACHGAGSAYSAEATMRDKHAAAAAGLKAITRETCLSCHDHAHDQPFYYEKALAEIAHPTRLPPRADEPRYKTPRNLAMRPDGMELYVACEASHEVIVVDTRTRRAAAVIPVGHQPEDVTFSPDGSRAYVSHRLDDAVSVIDVATRKVIATAPVGGEPHGVLTDRSGKTLYVLNMTSDSISVIDTSSLKEIKRLAASRSPWSAALTPDGSHMYITNNLSRLAKFREPPMSEVTVIDTETAMVEDRCVVPQANLLQGIAWHPSGDFALFTLNRSKNLVPMTRLLQGWTITNGLGILWKDGRVDQVLLDEPGICFPDPTGMAITPDGKLALVTSSGSNRVAVVDIQKLMVVVKAASEEERARVLPNHLGKATEFVIAHIPTGQCPRGIVVAPDGQSAYVANSLDDSVSVVDLGALRTVARIDLGGPTVITKARFGERVFNSANNTFHRQFSCHTCHPDGHIDGLTYNTEPGGIGIGPVDNRTLRGILDTAPFKWEGTNPTLSRQCGPRLAVFFTRIQPFTPKELSALDYYVCTIPRPPNRYRPLGAPLTDTQRRGKAIFERTMTNDGRMIPKERRCITCHFPPYYTDREIHDVGTKMWLDRVSAYDVPHLNNIYDSAPYLHNGIAHSLEEIWTKYNPYDQHGVTNDMTKDQLNDLVEYLKTL
ncbi:MAG: multiheme c-type cytochrome [Thermoguttaceae bacterium]